MSPQSTTLTFQDRASKGLLFLMSLSKECISKMSPIWNMRVYSVSIYGAHRASWRFITRFPDFQWLFTSEEVNQMHYKLSVADFNNRNLVFKFLSVVFAIAHTPNTHNKCKLIFQVKLIDPSGLQWLEIPLPFFLPWISHILL